MRTVDLGKWHLSVDGDNYEAIGKAVDKILENIHEITPAKIHTPFKDFTTPTRLQTLSGTTFKKQYNSDSSTK